VQPDNGATGKEEMTTRHVSDIVLVMHRLIEINEDSGKLLFITRGDSRKEPDKPWTREQLLGIAVSYRYFKKSHSVNTFIPCGLRYIFNRRLLWLAGKLGLRLKVEKLKVEKLKS